MNSATWNGNNRVLQCLRLYIQPLFTLCFTACIGRHSGWVALKPTTVKRKKCPSALPKIPNNRKNAAFLRNQATSIAACILSLTNIAIVLTRRYKRTGRFFFSICQNWIVHKGGMAEKPVKANCLCGASFGWDHIAYFNPPNSPL